MILCALFSVFIAAGAFIRIPIPVVPFTLQFLFTTLAGILLGAKAGAVSVGIYIAMGLIGLPVFAEGGGFAYVLKPSLGYIIGFAAAAYVTGAIAEKSERPGVKRLLAAAFAGLAIVYVFGMVYYYFMSNFYLGTPIGLWPLFIYCFVLAVRGDIVLCAVVEKKKKRLIPVIKKKRV